MLVAVSWGDIFIRCGQKVESRRILYYIDLCNMSLCICEVRSVGSLGLVAKKRMQFTNEPPLVRALQLV